MILDGQNVLSDLAAGDKPTAVADNASANVIDQQGKGSIFTEGGGARVPLWIVVRVQTTFTTTSGTIQAVLQDSPDNVTWTDRLLGAVLTPGATTTAAGLDLLNARIPFSPKPARYLRIVYRIATAVMTAGTAIAFMTPEQDVFDLSERQATGTVAAPSGAQDESVANGVLAS